MIIEVENASKNMKNIGDINQKLNDLYLSKKIIDICRDLYQKKFIAKKKK